MRIDRGFASLAASVLTVLAVVATVAAVGSGVGAAANTGTVSDCTTIDAPGRYVLDEDVDGSGVSTCIAVTSSDVVLDGGGHAITGASSGVGVHVDGSSGARLTNVTVTDLTVTDWGTGLHYEASDDGAVANVTATSNGDYGMHFESATDVTVDGAVAADHQGYLSAGLRIEGSTGVSVSGLDSTNNQHGVYVYGGSGHAVVDSAFADDSGVNVVDALHVTVRENAFEDTSPAVDVDDSGDVLVDGNVIVDGSLGVVSGSNGPANRITNNSVSESSRYATGADCGGMTVDGAEDDLVANNTWTECNSGVRIDDSERIEFRNNTITGTDGGNADYGLRVSGGTGHLIADNRIEGNGVYPERAGIFLGTHRATLSGNTLAGNGFNLDVGHGNWSSHAHSIDATNTVEGRPVAYHVNETDVTVDPNAGWVGLVGTRNATIADMDFAANNRENVFLLEADDTLVSNVTATPSWVGMRIWEGSDRTRIEDSRFDWGRGLSLLEATETTVVNTSITNSDAHGVFLSSSPDTTFENVTITGSDWSGIRVRNGESTTQRVTVANSTVSDNGWGGIDLYRAVGSVVRDSVVETNDGTGIRTQRYVNDVTIARNSVANNAGDGVYFDLYQEDNDVVDNVITGNGGDGLSLNNQDTDDATGVRGNRITGNVITDNAAIGIDLGSRGEDDLIRGNDLAGNAVGIEVPAEYHNLTVYDNAFDNTENVVFADASGLTNAIWNATAAAGANVIGGSTVGGNYWAAPDGAGFSETCGDADADGICDATYEIDASHVDHLPLAAAGAPAPAPDIAVSPTAVDFGGVDLGESATESVVVANTGTAPLNVTDVELDGPGASEFWFGGSVTPTIAPGETHAISANYEPSTNATHEMTLRIRSNDTDEPAVDVALRGTGLADPTPSTAPDVSVAPTTVDFGNVTVDESATVDVEVRNDGDEPLAVTKTHLDYRPANGSDAFSYANGGPSVLAPGANRTLSVTFEPTAPGKHDTVIVVSSNDTDESSAIVYLLGEGIPAATPAPPSGNSGGGSGSSGSSSGSGGSGSNSGGSGQTPPATTVDVSGAAAGVTDVAVSNARNGTAVSVNTSGHQSGNVSLDGLDVTPLVDGDFTLNVSVSESPPPGAPANAPTGEAPIAYLNVDHSIADADIGAATFRFRVSKRSLAARGLAAEDVVVYRYHDGSWEPATMTVAGETADAVLLEATVPGLSVFAVSTDASASDETPTETATERPTQTASDTPQSGGAEDPEPVERSGFPVGPALAALALVGAAVAVWFSRR